MKRSGRSKLGGDPFSRLQFSCAVPNCGHEARSDALKRHYLSYVKFDDNGDPLKPEDPSFVTLSVKHKEHTRYFHVNNFTNSESYLNVLQIFDVSLQCSASYNND